MVNNLKAFRKQSNLTLQQLADSCHLSKSYIWEIENKKVCAPSLLNAYTLAKVLGRTVYDLFPDKVEIVEEQITVRRIKQGN